MKKSSIYLILLILISVSVAAATLECNIRNPSCNVGEVDVLGMSQASNAEAELPSQSYYSYRICCKDIDGTNAPLETNNYGALFLKLSEETNAQVEQSNLSYYTYDAYISSESIDYEVTCGYGLNNCDDYQTCLATMSAETNAHLGNCSEYDITVCCRLDPTNNPPPGIPEFSTIGITLTLLIGASAIYFISRKIRG